MGMYDNLKDIVRVFRFDETLLRLLYYPPEDVVNGNPDPLDVELENILDMDEETQWQIRDERIMLIPKASDLEQKSLCRIYVYAGRRRPIDSGYVYANQEVIVDIFCHSSYEKDSRSLKIGDRIENLLVNKNITGMGKAQYVIGRQIPAPFDYVGYSHTFEFGSMK